MCFPLRIRSSSWWTLFLARNCGIPWLRPSVWQVLPLLSLTTDSMCQSLSMLRAQLQCPTASQPFRYTYMFPLTVLHYSKWLFCHFKMVLFCCLIHSSLLLMSCLNLWPQPMCWCNQLARWLQRASFSAKHLSHLMSMYDLMDTLMSFRNSWVPFKVWFGSLSTVMHHPKYIVGHYT